MDYLPLAVAIACAIFWYRGAQVENMPALAWVGPSLVISVVVIFALKLGWIAVAVAQVVLFAAITVYRTLSDGRKDAE